MKKLNFAFCSNRSTRIPLSTIDMEDRYVDLRIKVHKLNTSRQACRRKLKNFILLSNINIFNAFERSNQRQNIPVEEEKLQNNVNQKVENVQKSATDTTVASPQNSIMTPSEVIEATNANSSKKLLSNRQIAGVIVEILKSNGGSLPIENIAEEFAKKTQIPLIMLVRIKLKVRI